MKKIILASLLSLSIFALVGTAFVYAQPTGSDSNQSSGEDANISIRFENPFSGGDTLYDLLKAIVTKILLPIGGVLAVLAFIYSGFLYIKARGNSVEIQKAHKALLFTAIGTALLLGAWTFANVICSTIGQIGGPICPPSL